MSSSNQHPSTAGQRRERARRVQEAYAAGKDEAKLLPIVGRQYRPPAAE